MVFSLVNYGGVARSCAIIKSKAPHPRPALLPQNLRPRPGKSDFRISESISVIGSANDNVLSMLIKIRDPRTTIENYACGLVVIDSERLLPGGKQRSSKTLAKERETRRQIAPSAKTSRAVRSSGAYDLCEKKEHGVARVARYGSEFLQRRTTVD